MTERAPQNPTVTGVDCHAHVMLKSAPLVAGRHSEPKHDIAPEDFIAVLDAHRVSHGVLTQPSFYGTDNSLLLAALAHYPTRLRGTAIVPTDTGVDALVALKAAGVAGVRLNWFRRDVLPDIRGAEYGALLGHAREAGLHVEIYLEGAKLADVLPVVRKSGAVAVIDHFGSPEPGPGVDGAGFREVLKGVAAGDTWVKLSGPYRLGGAPAPPYAAALLDAGGDRVVWGSDWPWVSFEDGQSYQRCLDDLHRWIPDDAMRARVFRHNPAALFGFSATSAEPDRETDYLYE